MDMVFDMKPIN